MPEELTTEEWIEAKYPGLFAALKIQAEMAEPSEFPRLAAISLREFDRRTPDPLAEAREKVVEAALDVPDIIPEGGLSQEGQAKRNRFLEALCALRNVRS